MKRYIAITAGCFVFVCLSCSQSKSVSAGAENNKLSKVASPTLSKQELAIQLYEATHNVKLSQEEISSVLSTDMENLNAWQKVLEFYSGNSEVNLDYVNDLITGMKNKL